MELHSLTRERFSSIKKFTERVFSVVKKLCEPGQDISDAEVNGVLYCGIDQEVFAIQLDKWTGDYTGKKYTPADIAIMNSSCWSATLRSARALLSAAFLLLKLSWQETAFL